MVLDNKYKGNTNYEDLGKSSGGGDVWGGGYVGGVGEEIRRWVCQ